MLYKLPRLKFLDSSPVAAAEIKESKRVGPFMQVVRPKTESTEVCYQTLNVCPTSYGIYKKRLIKKFFLEESF